MADIVGPKCLTNLVGDGWVEPLVVHHLFPDILPGHLVQLIHGRRDGAEERLRYTTDLEDTVENLAGVELDGVCPAPPKAVKDLVDDADLRESAEPAGDRRRATYNLGIGDHGVVDAGNVKARILVNEVS